MTVWTLKSESAKLLPLSFSLSRSHVTKNVINTLILEQPLNAPIPSLS